MGAPVDELASSLAFAFGEAEAMEAMRLARTAADARLADELVGFVARDSGTAGDWTCHRLESSGDDVSLFF